MNNAIGSLSLSGLPYTASLNDHKKPLSLGMRDAIYCAVSLSIPSGFDTERYPLHAVNMVDFVPSVPKVATRVQPKLFFDKSSISLLKYFPRSFLISFKMSGRLLGLISKSISGNSALSLFIYRKNGRFHLIGSSCVTPNK